MLADILQQHSRECQSPKHTELQETKRLDRGEAGLLLAHTRAHMGARAVAQTNIRWA